MKKTSRLEHHATSNLADDEIEGVTFHVKVRLVSDPALILRGG